MFAWIVLILHIIGCAVIWFLTKTGKLKMNPAMMPVVACIPIFGELCAVAIHFIVMSGSDGRSKIYREGRKAAPKDDEVELKPEEQPLVVPLEEALVLNENSIRRTLIMDILTDNPDEYLNVLNQARLNEDTEVVHYAVTAVTELTKQYDLQLQKLESDYVENPGSREVLDRYILFLKDYIDKEIAQGQYLLIQRNQLDGLLKKRLRQEADVELYELLVDNEIELRMFSEAGVALEQMEQNWPEAEQTWLLKLKYYVVQGKGERVQELIRLVDQRQIYMSVEGKGMLDFWRPKTEYE